MALSYATPQNMLERFDVHELAGYSSNMRDFGDVLKDAVAGADLSRGLLSGANC